MELTVFLYVVLGFFLGYSFCSFLVHVKGGLPGRETRTLGKSTDRRGLKQALVGGLRERNYGKSKAV